MRHTLKIGYSVYLKNKNRPSAHYYARVRQSGKVRDIDLKTTSKDIAEAWVRLRRSELEQFNQYILLGEQVPAELERKLVRADMADSDTETALRGPISKTRLLDQFARELAARGSRARTVELYCKNVGRILPDNVLLSDFNMKTVRLWLSKVQDRSTATRKCYSVALRELCKVMVSQYGVNPNILTGWQMVKVESKNLGAWTMPQMVKIIESVKCKDPEVAQCYQAFFYYLATTGCRQGEAGLLEWSDIDEHGVVTVRAEINKTGTSRRLPLDPRILQMLYKLPKKSKYVFASISPIQQGRYAVLQNAIRRSGMPAGNLHKFRHSVALLMYKATNDLKATAEYLCHSPAVSLKYYSESRQADELRSVVDKTFGAEILLPDSMDDLIKAGLV